MNHMPESTRPKVDMVAADAAMMEFMGSCTHWPKRAERVSGAVVTVACALFVIVDIRSCK